MSEETRTQIPLVSDRPSDSNLAVSLHPLVLLTISDHITRHQVRGYSGNIVGALLGQQKGRETTLEHAFACNVQLDEQNQARLQTEWFEDRLQQYKDVHKAPALELAGWFTLCPESGPTLALLPIHKQFLGQNESALFLAFHPSAASSGAATDTNGKLPLTIYETIYENEPTRQDDSMQIDGEDTSGLRFRPIPYTIETDETEMIAVDYVAKGGGNAAAQTGVEAEAADSPEAIESADRKGKRRADEPPGAKKAINGPSSTTILNAEEEEQIASMTTRLNSVRMLQSRLSLLSSYVSSLPPSNLSDPKSEISVDQPHLPHLRNIKALITRLSLLTPHSNTPPAPLSPNTSATPAAAIPSQPQTDPPSQAQQAQTNDVTLSSLLALLGQDVQALSELGRKFVMTENAKQGKGKKVTGGGGPGGMGFGAGFQGHGGGGGDDSIMI